MSTVGYEGGRRDVDGMVTVGAGLNGSMRCRAVALVHDFDDYYS